MAGSNNRKRPYGLLLLLALAMAVMCAVVLHQLREGRVLSLLLQERDQQLVTLQILLQKERENTKEMKRKIDDMKAKTFALRNQKMELTDKLTETRNTAAQLNKLKTELEAALMEKQIQVDKLTDKTEEFMLTNLKVTNLTSLLKQKEAEIEEMKQNLTNQAQVENSTAQIDKSQQESFSISDERKGEWDKFQTKKDEVDLKAQNVTLGIKEVNGVTKTVEEKVIQMKENESNRIGRVDHAIVEEINEQLKSPEDSELAAKNETGNAVIGIATDDKMIGSSPGQIQHDMAEKTQAVEGMTNFSIDYKSRADSESSVSNVSSSKKEREGNEQVRDNMEDEDQEAKNDKPEEDQRETDDENSKAEGQGSSSKNLQLQEDGNAESNQSSQENGDVFNETIQKKNNRKQDQ